MLPTSPDELDAALLAQARPQWRKVALVLALTAETFGELGDSEFDILAERLHTLVSAGKLQAQGDLAKWRRSEVRLPD